jgi:hypothetical protein
MLSSLASALLLLFLAAEIGFSQIGYPGQSGQYPGQYPQGQGRYPGGGGGLPFPTGRRTRNDQEQTPTQNFTGRLRRISSSELVLETEDKRVVTISIANVTRYFKSQADADAATPRSSSTAKRMDFEPGDQVSVDATQDDNSYFHAVKIALVKQGTANDRAKAAGPVDESPVAGATDKSDDDRP